MATSATSHECSFDVVVCGGGLAGLLLARQLRREQPELSVAVLERQRRPLDDACHKVGESSVELGSQHLERLGLADYLLERQLVKFGLRFFPGGGRLPIARRSEIGPGHEPIVRSYQLDRGRFENDLRGFVEADGAMLVEGARVQEIVLATGGAPHRVRFHADARDQEFAARWVVDATGRAALLRRSMKLTRSSRHAASAGWFRIAGRLDINDLVPQTESEWHARPGADQRWRSTNHFMGAGYWAWVIPLASGKTSIGLVTHDEVHDPRNIMRFDRVMAFLHEHEPVLAERLDRAEVLDFLCLRQYSHTISRGWSADRWALVGEAGAFVDPLYSPGTDFIALANSFTCELIRADRAGEDFASKAEFLNLQYRGLVTATVDLFRHAAPVYGHRSALSAKVYWDNFAYWSYTCHYGQQQLYRLSAEEFRPFATVGRRFLELGGHVQRTLRLWAELAPEEPDGRFHAVPAFPSMLIDAHVAIASRMSTAQTLEYVTMRIGQAETVVAELALRIVQELGPVRARELLVEVKFWTWDVPVSVDRLALESLPPREREARLPTIAADVERSLGAVRRHADAGEARALLLSVDRPRVTGAEAIS